MERRVVSAAAATGGEDDHDDISNPEEDTQNQQAGDVHDGHSPSSSLAQPGERPESSAPAPAPAQEVPPPASGSSTPVQNSTKRKRAPKRKAADPFVHTSATTGADGKALVITKKPPHGPQIFGGF